MNSETAEPTAILLAAGKGDRYGKFKQLVEIAEKTLIQRAMDSIARLNWTHDPLLVLGCRAEMIKERVDTSAFRVLENPRWKDGMSTSVELGVRSSEAGTSGYIFFLGDMPLIPSSVIKKVVEEAKAGASIAAPTYRGQRGFPVFLDRRWKPELLEEISGDRGARRIINQNREKVKLLETSHRGVVLDVDEQSDLEEVESYLEEGGKEIGI